MRVLQRYREKNEATYLRKAIGLIDSQIEWVEKQLLTEKGISGCPLKRKESNTKKLQWTGSQAELVELLYALHEAGCINGGKITLTEIFDAFCRWFDIDLKNFSRAFTNIKNRTKGDRMAFLDRLKRVLMAKMEVADRRPLWK